MLSAAVAGRELRPKGSEIPSGFRITICIVHVCYSNVYNLCIVEIALANVNVFNRQRLTYVQLSLRAPASVSI